MEAVLWPLVQIWRLLCGLQGLLGRVDIEVNWDGHGAAALASCALGIAAGDVVFVEEEVAGIDGQAGAVDLSLLAATAAWAFAITLGWTSFLKIP